MHSLQAFAALLLLSTIIVSTGIQAYYDRSLSTLHSWRPRDDSRIRLLGFIEHVDPSLGSLKLRWEAGSDNVAYYPSIHLHFKQSELLGHSVLHDWHTHLSLGSITGNDGHVVTEHALDGSWKEWAGSDDPFMYPFDRYTFTAHVEAVDSKTDGPLAVSGIGIGDAVITRSSPALAITILPDVSAARNGTDSKSIGILVERTVPMKIAAFGMFGASWILTLATLYTTILALILEKSSSFSKTLLVSPIATIVAVLGARELGSLDRTQGVPGYGVFLDFVGVYAQVSLMGLLIIVTPIISWRKRKSEGAIAL